MAVKQKSDGPIELPKLERKTFRAYVVGDTSLIVHAWSRKAITEMLAKQMGQKVPKFPKHPVEDFMASMYRMDDGGYGFPATAIKKALVATCTSMSKEITKVAAQQALFVKAGRGTQTSAFSGRPAPVELVQVFSPVAPQMREDSVRLNGRTPDLRYRAEFFPWAMRLDIVYNARVVTSATVAALLDTAGFACGLGEWRQERGGINGQFRLASPQEQKEIDKWAKMKPVEPEVSAADERAFLSRIESDIRQYGEVTEAEDAVPAAKPNGRPAQKGARQ